MVTCAGRNGFRVLLLADCSLPEYCDATGTGASDPMANAEWPAVVANVPAVALELLDADDGHAYAYEEVVSFKLPPARNGLLAEERDTAGTSSKRGSSEPVS